MLIEMTEYVHKIEEEVKAIQSEMKKNIQEPTVKGRKPGLKSTFGTKGRNIYSVRT